VSLIVDKLVKWAVSHRTGLTAPRSAGPSIPRAVSPTHRTRGAHPQLRRLRLLSARASGRRNRELLTPQQFAAVLLVALAVTALLAVQVWTWTAYAWTCHPGSTQYYCESWTVFRQHYAGRYPNSHYVFDPSDDARD
jgi:hypothetical protein